MFVFSSNHAVNSLLNAAAYNNAFTVYFVDVMLVSKRNIQKWAFLLGFFSRTYIRPIICRVARTGTGTTVGFFFKFRLFDTISASFYSLRCRYFM